MATEVNKKAAAKKLTIRFITDPPLSWLLLAKGSSRLFTTTPLDERCYFRSGLTYNQKLNVRYVKVPFPPWLREMNQCRALVTLDFEMCVKITGSVFECRGKRGGPLSSANLLGIPTLFRSFCPRLW